MGSEFRTGGRKVWPGLRYEVAASGALVVHTPDVCPPGLHRLGPRDAHYSWSPGYCTHVMTCWACHDLDRDQGDWVLVDPAWNQLSPDKARGMGIELVAFPPALPAAAGRIEVRLDWHPVGHVDVALCAACRTGVLEEVSVVPEHRRYGLGRVLVLAALARGRGYAWSATSGEPAAFWAAIAPHLPTPVTGERAGCEHIDAAATWSGLPRGEAAPTG